MYRCEVCGCEFDDPKVAYETHGLDHPPYEKIYLCPSCGSEDYEEVEDDEEGTL